MVTTSLLRINGVVFFTTGWMEHFCNDHTGDGGMVYSTVADS